MRYGRQLVLIVTVVADRQKATKKYTGNIDDSCYSGLGFCWKLIFLLAYFFIVFFVFFLMRDEFRKNKYRS